VLLLLLVVVVRIGEMFDLKEDGEIRELVICVLLLDDVELIDSESDDGDEVDEFEPHDLFSLLTSMGLPMNVLLFIGLFTLYPLLLAYICGTIFEAPICGDLPTSRFSFIRLF
jgi:hypothetical protein